ILRKANAGKQASGAVDAETTPLRDSELWTIKAAIDEAVPAPVLTTALYERFSSRGEADFANRVLSAMRYGFWWTSGGKRSPGTKSSGLRRINDDLCGGVAH